MGDEKLFSREEAEVFAQGLLHVAGADGESPEERALIAEFLSQAGHADVGDVSALETFRPVHLSCLSDSHIRQVFLKVAVALVYADNNVTRAEVDALHEVADALGMGREVLHLAFDSSLASAALGT